MYISVPSSTSMSDKVKAGRRAFDPEFKCSLSKNIMKVEKTLQRQQGNLKLIGSKFVRGLKRKSK